jgi:hypothetical protein
LLKESAATTAEIKKIYSTAVTSWNSAIRAYGSKIRSIELEVKKLQAAKLAAQNKPAELARNVTDSRATANLICTKGL